MFQRLSNTLLILFFLVLLCSSRSTNPIDDFGRYKGVCLQGNVFLETNWANDKAFRAYYCEHDYDADIRVFFTDNVYRIGHWHVVTELKDADFSVYVMGEYERIHLGLTPDFYFSQTFKPAHAGLNRRR